ncbi:MAG: hypothetical protein ACXIVG_11510 [Pararhodobacter sp.]|nr:hypothetical protein [Paracoccaceae bacterium]
MIQGNHRDDRRHAARRALLAATVALIPVLGLGLAGAAQAEPRRSVIVEGARFGYTALEGQVAHDPAASGGGPLPGAGFRSGLSIVIVTRDGRPVTEADRPAATEAARAVCEATRRPFDDTRAPRMLQRGGFSFAGACG